MMTDKQMLDLLTWRIKRDEGYSAQPYWDKKQWTWGFGTAVPNVEHRKDFFDGKRLPIISIHLAEEFLKRYILDCINEFKIYYRRLEPVIDTQRKLAFINMLFNMGLPALSGFKEMHKHLNTVADVMTLDIHEETKQRILKGLWAGVAFEAYNSKWYNEVGKRSYRIVREIAYNITK
jgi:GH24 family phage-related lysozyme (muramidase)